MQKDEQQHLVTDFPAPWNVVSTLSFFHNVQPFVLTKMAVYLFQVRDMGRQAEYCCFILVNFVAAIAYILLFLIQTNLYSFLDFIFLFLTTPYNLDIYNFISSIKVWNQYKYQNTCLTFIIKHTNYWRITLDEKIIITFETFSHLCF